MSVQSTDTQGTPSLPHLCEHGWHFILELTSSWHSLFAGTHFGDVFLDLGSKAPVGSIHCDELVGYHDRIHRFLHPPQHSTTHTAPQAPPLSAPISV